MESTYLLYKATRDPRYLDAGRDMITSLQYGARCPCGYCHISDVESHKQEDHMESFFLAETVKYLWLLFDLAAGPNNLVESGPYKYIFSTEGHLLPITPEIALLHEHCSYFGAFCKGNDAKRRSVFNMSDDLQENNGTRFLTSWEGGCPGLSHTKKFGISYRGDADDTTREGKSTNQQEGSVVQSHPVVLVTNTDMNSMSNEIKVDDGQWHI